MINGVKNVLIIVIVSCKYEVIVYGRKNKVYNVARRIKKKR